MTIAGWLAAAGAEINARFVARRPWRAGMVLGRSVVDGSAAVTVKSLRKGRADKVEISGSVLSPGPNCIGDRKGRSVVVFNGAVVRIDGNGSSAID